MNVTALDMKFKTRWHLFEGQICTKTVLNKGTVCMVVSDFKKSEFNWSYIKKKSWLSQAL